MAANLEDAFKTDIVTTDPDAAPLMSAGSAAGYQVGSTATLEDTIASIINIILSFLGVIFLFLMIYGGYTWMMARGNEQEVDKAKNTIKAATIGLVVVMGSYAFAWFILEKFGEGTLT